MSEAVFSTPSAEQLSFLAQARDLAGQMAQELIPGFRLDRSVSDLEMLQAIVDSGMLADAADPQFLLRCLGVVFGDVLRTSLPAGFEWRTITDQYGCDLGLRYRETTLIVFPVTMLSKRAEDGREIELAALRTGLVEHVQGMIASGDYQ